MKKKLIQAQKCAESVRDCVSKIENWLCHRSGGSEKVHIEYIDELLCTNPVSCNEPGYHKLKVGIVR